MVSAFFFDEIIRCSGSEEKVVIHHYNVVDSTNTAATQLAASGAAHGTVIHAERQTGGRGRAGRNFESPAGGLYFSVILRPTLTVDDLPLITLAVGVGLCTEIRKAANVDVSLKWPNDLFLDNRKLGGILTESGSFRGVSVPEFVIVGVGINVTTQLDQFPLPLRSKVISLCEEKQDHTFDLPLQPLVDGILSTVEELAVNRDQILVRWRTHDYLLNREVVYDSAGGGVTHAIGKGLAADGRYVVSDRRGVEHHILAGDITPIHLI